MTEEQSHSQAEIGSPMPLPAAAVAAAPAPPARRRGGFFGRFLAALLVIIITTCIVLVAVAVAYVYVLETPQQFAEVQAQLRTAQAQSLVLQFQNNALQTQIASQGQRGDTDHETLGDLKHQLADLDQLRVQLRQEREQSASQNATLVAEARDSRDSVALFATAEASRSTLLAELDRRSARIERFLQRLSDISSDTALDLGATTLPAAPIVEITPTAPPSTAVASNTSIPNTSVPTEPPTPTQVVTATRSPSATPRPPAPTIISELSPTSTPRR